MFHNLLGIFFAHPMILSRYGTNDFPIGLREYSTVGGTVLKECRSTSPSATRVFRVALSIRAEMSGISFLSSLNRVVGLRVSVYMTSKPHFSEKRARMLRIGQ